jgi:protein-S-isoprenylcysteine O-methyltransferase Ste14
MSAMGFPLPLWPTIFVFPLALCFYYFLLAGGRTFEFDEGDEGSAALAQVSFAATGMGGTLVLGLGGGSVPPWNAVAGGVLMAGAIVLYEWGRHTIWNRGFHIAWTGEAPDALCEDGPYRFIRHPLYTSYIVAFAAQLAALPSLWTVAIFLFNAGLYIHAAFDDERSLAKSALAAAYTEYKPRTGMFLPRPGRWKPGTQARD